MAFTTALTAATLARAPSFGGLVTGAAGASGRGTVIQNPYIPTSGFASPQNSTTADSFATGQTYRDKEAASRAAPSFFESLNRGGGGGSGIPGSFQAGPGTRTGTQISEFGRKDFDAALVDWNRVYQDAQQGIPAALELIEQFAPGGGFGTGRRLEARRLIGEGVARDTAASVASGLSSTSSARGLNVLAGRELATQFGDIEDQRAQLQIAAFSPYTQMLTNLANIGTERPTTSRFIERISTPLFGGSSATRTGGGFGRIA